MNVLQQVPERSTTAGGASPRKKTQPPEAVEQSGNNCTCTTINITSVPSSCTCCVIHISNQPCPYCSNREVRSPAPLIRCSSCSSIMERSSFIAGQGNPPDNGSKRPTGLAVVGMRRSASVTTMQSGTSLLTTSKVNANASNNRESIDRDKDDIGDAKIEIYHEDGEMQLQEPPDDEKTVVIIPCLPGIKNPKPDPPRSSECLPAAKYIILYIVYILSYPWACAFTWTVPKCDNPERRKWYMVSFILCIGWIALLSWVMIVLVEKMGCLLNIDSYPMGLVIVAVGTSVPDAISSILVAKDGRGDMAVSNALGSNVFDINLGLGLPFFLGSLITSKPISLMSPLQTCLFETLPLSIRIVPHVKFGLILLVILLIAVAIFVLVKFRLNKRVTYLFVTMYIVFMIYAFVQEKKCHSFYC